MNTTTVLEVVNISVPESISDRPATMTTTMMIPPKSRGKTRKSLPTIKRKAPVPT
jgi:hypothetical protein